MNTFTFQTTSVIRAGIAVLATVVLLSAFAQSATAQTSPNPRTESAYSVGERSATVLGSVAPGSTGEVTAWFQYSTSASFSSSERTDSRTYYTAVNVQERLLDLQPDTQYHYRFVADSLDGRIYGETKSFRTKDIAQGERLEVRTLNPEGVSATAARLKGEVDPRGDSNVTRWFQWGSGTSRNNVTAKTTHGTEVDTFTHTLTGLQSNNAYSYRAVAENSQGYRYYGDIESFTPSTLSGRSPSGGSGGSGDDDNNGGGFGSVSATTLMAGNATKSSVTFRGEVSMSRAVSTDVYFEYGPTPDLGRTSATQSFSGYTRRTVGRQVSGLKEGTAYFYRVVVENRFGTDRGETLVTRTEGESSFTPTPTPTPKPTPDTDKDICPAGCVPEKPECPEGCVPADGKSTTTATSTDKDNGMAATLFGTGFLPDTLIGWLIIILLILLITLIAYYLTDERKKRKEAKQKAEEAQKQAERQKRAQDTWPAPRPEDEGEFRLPGQ